jgi:hypothetical protein
MRFDATAEFRVDSVEGRGGVGAGRHRHVHPDILRARADEAGAFGAAQLEAS